MESGHSKLPGDARMRTLRSGAPRGACRCGCQVEIAEAGERELNLAHQARAEFGVAGRAAGQTWWEGAGTSSRAGGDMASPSLPHSACLPNGCSHPPHLPALHPPLSPPYVPSPYISDCSAVRAAVGAGYSRRHVYLRERFRVQTGMVGIKAGFFFLAAKYGGIDSDWCINGGNHPHLQRNVFWRQKRTLYKRRGN
jgi:hypothetical protein